MDDCGLWTPLPNKLGWQFYRAVMYIYSTLKILEWQGIFPLFLKNPFVLRVFKKNIRARDWQMFLVAQVGHANMIV